MGRKKQPQKVRGICSNCRKNQVAINYHSGEIVHYRSKCAVCYKKKKKPVPPGWLRSGYKKKEKCDKCGFRFKSAKQSSVFHTDGNIANVNWVNLKTICSNCAIELADGNMSWKPGDITPDF